MIIKVQSNNSDRWHIYDEVSHLDYTRVNLDKAIDGIISDGPHVAPSTLVIEDRVKPCASDGLPGLELYFDDYYKQPRHIITNCAVYLCTNHGKTIERLI